LKKYALGVMTSSGAKLLAAGLDVKVAQRQRHTNGEISPSCTQCLAAAAMRIEQNVTRATLHTEGEAREHRRFHARRSCRSRAPWHVDHSLVGSEESPLLQKDTQVWFIQRTGRADEVTQVIDYAFAVSRKEFRGLR
jgi:hypothetical protein